ncbi:hypothetical protein BD413DRAFT_568049 [Trametes elegans]|nr:hypothetical protein BD413DRAFT_568049 [Trametes elegans]
MSNATHGVDTVTTLLDGHSFILRRPYSSQEAKGVLILAIASCISATAVSCLLLAIAVSAYNTRHSTARNLFLRSHVAAYFICMLLCDLAQTAGSIMSMRWYNQMAVVYEPYCTAQGVVKHVSDVGTALWSLIIALNTFWILFLRWKLRKVVLFAAVIGGWSSIGALVTAGPTGIHMTENGPFYAISGLWCWISNEYPSERITLDYMIMFLSALLTFLMYILVFLRLRGNISVHGWRVSIYLRRRALEHSFQSVDTHAVNVAKGMLLYPIGYTVLLLPIAICRFSEWSGHPPSATAVIFSDAIFLLSGFVNVVLFLTTRRVLPANSVFPHSLTKHFQRNPSPHPDPNGVLGTTGTATLTDLEKTGVDAGTPVTVRSYTTAKSSAPRMAFEFAAPPHPPLGGPGVDVAVGVGYYAASKGIMREYDLSSLDSRSTRRGGGERRQYTDSMPPTPPPKDGDTPSLPAAGRPKLTVDIPPSAFRRPPRRGPSLR